VHVMSSNVLVGGVVLYRLKVTIDFWEESAYYYLHYNLAQDVHL
jgi:hypothetical protein